MSIAGSRVAIVGGSIAGCAAAIALRRAGCDVTVYERTRGMLRDRGFGIGIPAPLHDHLLSAGYLAADTPVCRYTERQWLIGDPALGQGRRLAVQRAPVACDNWAVLWRALRAKIPDAAYHAGVTVTGIRTGLARPEVTFLDGNSEAFDLVAGADGYQSVVRRIVAPEATLQLSGYGLWRGTCPEALLPARVRRAAERYLLTIVYRGGHGIAYLIPDHVKPRHRMLNWGVYIVPPARFTDPRLIPPGHADGGLLSLLDRVLTEHFPSAWADAIRRTSPDRVSVQPVYDLTTSAYVAGRLVLLGDAGAVARPHTASGATTALLDALALERWCRTGRDWDEILGGYQRERGPAGNVQAEFGRVLGRAQVTDTPDWNGMSPQEFKRWWPVISAGYDLRES